MCHGVALHDKRGCSVNPGGRFKRLLEGSGKKRDSKVEVCNASLYHPQVCPGVFNENRSLMVESIVDAR